MSVFVQPVSGGEQMPYSEVSSMQCLFSPQEASGSGDGEVETPEMPGSIPLRADYYQLLRQYYGQSHGSTLVEDFPYVYLTRPTSVSAGSREETLAKISAFLKLEDGWDGYGGYSPSTSTCEFARIVVTSLASKFPELPSPEISPTPNGTITLSWEAPVGHACIEMGDEKFSAYVRRENHFIPIKGECSELGADELQFIWTYLYQ